MHVYYSCVLLQSRSRTKVSRQPTLPVGGSSVTVYNQEDVLFRAAYYGALAAKQLTIMRN
jgi:hypothetical protein